MRLLRVVMPAAALESLSDRLTEDPEVEFWQVWEVKSRLSDGHAFASVADRVAGYTPRVCFEILTSNGHVDELVQLFSTCPMCVRGGGMYWTMDVGTTGEF